jgi:hypothetical protein
MKNEEEREKNEEGKEKNGNRKSTRKKYPCV